MQLGTSNDANWYNSRVVPDGSGFLTNQNYFTGSNNEWTKFKLNVSRFAGRANVAFRVVFKSGSTSPLAGMAIDDFEINKYEGEAKTQIVELTGAFARSITRNGQQKVVCIAALHVNGGNIAPKTAAHRHCGQGCASVCIINPV